MYICSVIIKQLEIMKTYNILNYLENIVKTIKVKTIEDANDIIYDLKDYHGHYSVFTLEEVK